MGWGGGEWGWGAWGKAGGGRKEAGGWGGGGMGGGRVMTLQAGACAVPSSWESDSPGEEE